jgi:hypothetical protein
MTLAISWSSLKRWELCHHRHYRTLRGEVSRIPFKRSMLPGSIVDLIEREWLSETDPRPGGMRKIAPDVIDRLTNPDRGDDAFEPFTYKGDPRADHDAIVSFVHRCIDALEPVLMRLVVPHDYQPEVPFSPIIGIPYLDGQLVGIRLRGRIDIVSRLRYPDLGFAKGDFINYDLKATVNDAYISTTLGQGTFYDLGWQAWHGVRPSRFGFIAPALEQQLWWSDIADQDRAVMMDRIIAMAHGMWRGSWDPKIDDEGCDYCEARHACVKFSKHLVTDDVGRRRISFEESLSRRWEGRAYELGEQVAADEGEARRPGAAAGSAGG